ncbi:hypothetical protein HX37_25610 [Salmonella enterica]|uniref:Uncharacterized protein n=1 Tax=Salmonella enterica TaxID=28901 RepID=A0A5U2F609_SALER|nr:hypothetical protein [Salmonella enterica]
MEQQIKHKTLQGILESLRQEAPERYKRYSLSQSNLKSHVYSLCYIHLYLKVRHGLVDFNQREILSLMVQMMVASMRIISMKRLKEFISYNLNIEIIIRISQKKRSALMN